MDLIVEPILRLRAGVIRWRSISYRVPRAVRHDNSNRTAREARCHGCLPTAKTPDVVATTRSYGEDTPGVPVTCLYARTRERPKVGPP